MQLLLDFRRGPERRQSALLRLRRQAGLFQPFGTTADDRYPQVFAFLRDALAANARLFSFGCSTGEEVLTLRRYFPGAHITGMDISPERIAICRTRVPEGDAAMNFAIGDSARGERDGVYDAVLAMAVFRHGRLDAEAATINRILSFDRFEREMDELARIVRPGGYLAIRHANFRFVDARASRDFEVVLRQKGTAVLYGRDGRRLPPQAQEDAVFRKL